MAEKKEAFLNPFENGVTYEEFLKAIPKGKTVEEYCKGKIEGDDLNWLVEEIEIYKKIKK